MKDRLELIDQELSAKIISATSIQHRQITQIVCEFVIARMDEVGNNLKEVLTILQLGEVSNIGIRNNLKKYYEELDEMYFDLYDLYDNGEIPKEDYLLAFAKARAANTFYCATDDDPLIAALESTYEAIFATDAEIELKNRILAMLENEYNNINTPK